MKKKFLILILIVCFICGCGKNVDNELNEEPTKTNVVTKTSSSKKTENTTTTTTTVIESTTRKTTTTKITSISATSTTTRKTLPKGVYISVKDNKEHPFTYVYDDKATCEKNAQGETPYDEVYETHPYMLLGCEEVMDETGRSYWGIYFLSKPDENSKFYY